MAIRRRKQGGFRKVKGGYMKSITSFIGWLLLAVILAVPAFLFYNWWMTKKNVQMKETAVVSDPIKIPFESEKVDFPPIEEEILSTETSKVVEPVDNMDSGIKKQPDAQQSMDVSDNKQADNFASENMQTSQVTPSDDASAQEYSSSVKTELSQSTAIVNVAVNQAEGTAENNQERQGSYFEPKVDRDPTLSPFEYAQIKAEKAAIKERERQRRLAELKKNTVSEIQTKLTLQGIVGKNVIINGEMYSVGSYVKGVKIVKIGSNYFIGSFKGKQFKKVMR